MTRMIALVGPVLAWAALLVDCHESSGSAPSYVSPDASGGVDGTGSGDDADAWVGSDGSVGPDGSPIDAGSYGDHDADSMIDVVAAACAANPKTLCPTAPDAQCPVYNCPPSSVPNGQPCGNAAPCFFNVNPCWDYQVNPPGEVDDWACGCQDGVLVCGLCEPGEGECRPEAGLEGGTEAGD
jgi:hypothetical protein